MLMENLGQSVDKSLCVQGAFAQVLTRFDLLQSPSGRPWTSHANPFSSTTNNSPSEARLLAPRITAPSE